jgi:tetratricopeptide (TPR) repeat protein
MLFDLRGRGRRRTIQVVYITLALLLGGGLVLFGIGGEVSGGLVDAITEREGGDDGSDRFTEQEAAALQRTRTDPKDAAAWAELARVRYQLAGLGDNYDPAAQTFTEAGQAQLQEAAQAWERHLQVAKEPDENVARVMVTAYAEIGDIAKAARAQEVIAEANPDNPNIYAQLAQLAWAAGQTRKGDLARDKALELTEPDMREALRGQLEQAKSQALQQQLEDAQEAVPSPSPAGG